MPTSPRSRRSSRSSASHESDSHDSHGSHGSHGSHESHSHAHRSSASPTSRTRSRQKRTVLGTVGQIPSFLRLLYGLITDSRVDPIDKLLVAGAVGYVVMPMDIIPDFIPVIGEIDDVFVLTLAIRRLMQNAGRTVLLDHWMGDPDELAELNLQNMLGAAAFFLPRRLRRRLRTIGRV